MKKVLGISLLLIFCFLFLPVNQVRAACDNPDEEIETAIGCINVKSPEGFVSNILTLAIGIGGGLAVLLIIFGGIQILTSAGNPEKIQAGKELITSAIAGLVLIVFSVFILRIIGVEILDIFK